MAGQPSGLSAHTSTVPASPTPQAQRAPLRPVGSPGTRTRRNHGAFSLGGQLACVYSTRRTGQCYGVSFELGAGTLLLARQMARALSAAADAADLAQGGAQ